MQATLLRGITGASSRTSASGCCSPVSSTPAYSGSPAIEAMISSPSAPPTTPNLGSSSVANRAILTTDHPTGRPYHRRVATVVLEPDVWRAARHAHEGRVDAWITPFLERRSRGDAHPV